VFVNGVPSKFVRLCAPDVIGGAYSRVKPCPDAPGMQTLMLDTEKDPGWVNGANDLRVCSYDVAGNESRSCVRRIVDVDTSCPASGSQSAAKLEAGAEMGGRLRTQASIRSTESPVIRGALTTSRGEPVAGGTICIFETIDLADASRELVTTASTQPNG